MLVQSQKPEREPKISQTFSSSCITNIIFLKTEQNKKTAQMKQYFFCAYLRLQLHDRSRVDEIRRTVPKVGLPRIEYDILIQQQKQSPHQYVKQRIQQHSSKRMLQTNSQRRF